VSQRSGISPWHMWGNTQTIDGVIETVGELRQGRQGQLCKISYLRPETWHWLFKAKLLSGPDNTPGFFTRIFVHWDLIVGIGRSSIRMVALENRQRVTAFDDFQFQWGPVIPTFPTDAQVWSTETRGPPKIFETDAFSLDSATIISEITAQDIQLQVTVVGLTIVDNVLSAGAPFSVEISAQFAPQTHVRPEWFKGGAFPGAEDGGATSNVAQQIEQLNKSNAPIDPADAPQGGELPWHPDAAEQEHYDGEQREIYRDEFGRIMDDDHRARSAPPIIHRPPALQRRIVQPRAQLPNPRKRSG